MEKSLTEFNVVLTAHETCFRQGRKLCIDIRSSFVKVGIVVFSRFVLAGVELQNEGGNLRRRVSFIGEACQYPERGPSSLLSD